MRRHLRGRRLVDALTSALVLLCRTKTGLNTGPWSVVGEKLKHLGFGGNGSADYKIEARSILTAPCHVEPICLVRRQRARHGMPLGAKWAVLPRADVVNKLQLVPLSNQLACAKCLKGTPKQAFATFHLRCSVAPRRCVDLERRLINGQLRLSRLYKTNAPARMPMHGKTAVWNRYLF